ncbi:class I SAM-dependent methyltransferase [Rhodovarius crocodyli]|uniref:Class I SAM-dependent methyltransferase n=1 Tax=Rhodovarius crocodyli TaxID=1979269 RepID=A0A437M2S0_9PROT|nr:cyclopropane-fatty-acyl-phospholipid synthase family protein [Rhodovarius crocodyli]RVT92009.1 class I SAM-dependent methyltransferase [Rhodovarius crocodyli]
MNLIAAATQAVERVPLPDSLTRAGISFLVNRTARKLRDGAASAELAFAEAMREHPIALFPEDANAQHYELPPEFFGLMLGPQRKYSCCLYPTATTTLAAAEQLALAETAIHADLRNGHRILELGCGWGSLSLWMAERFPLSRITAVSNSAPQRAYIEAQAAARGLTNLTVITADMNDFATTDRFDRVVSVEMFEHMSNWPGLLARIHGWLADDGRLFLHVFSHHSVPYRFETGDKADWIAQHFFTGGIMPSHNLIRHLDAPFVLEADWRWSGTHYERTALDWLALYDANAEAIEQVLRETYGADWALWRRRWRLFLLATAGLFGAAEGQEWGVSHYRLRRTG